MSLGPASIALWLLSCSTAPRCCLAAMGAPSGLPLPPPPLPLLPLGCCLRRSAWRQGSSRKWWAQSPSLSFRMELRNQSKPWGRVYSVGVGCGGGAGRKGSGSREEGQVQVELTKAGYKVLRRLGACPGCPAGHPAYLRAAATPITNTSRPQRPARTWMPPPPAGSSVRSGPAAASAAAACCCRCAALRCRCSSLLGSTASSCELWEPGEASCDKAGRVELASGRCKRRAEHFLHCEQWREALPNQCCAPPSLPSQTVCGRTASLLAREPDQCLMGERLSAQHLKAAPHA